MVSTLQEPAEEVLLAPTPRPSITLTPCTDQEDYRSRYDQPCHEFAGKACTEMWIIGFSPAEIGTLTARCPSSCHVCSSAAAARSPAPTSRPTPYVAPTAAPSPPPTGAPATKLPSAFRSETACTDSTTYTSLYGQTCGVFKNKSCQDMWIIGFSQDDIRELVESCPQSCRERCQRTATVEDVRATVAAPSPREVRTHRPSVCRDDASYDSPFDTPCSYFHGLECRSMGFLGLLDTEIEELVIRCPVSCDNC